MYEGDMIPTVLTLMPVGENLDVTFDFAEGGHVMPGKGTRKKS
jgi:hypothetical protein